MTTLPSQLPPGVSGAFAVSVSSQPARSSVAWWIWSPSLPSFDPPPDEEEDDRQAPARIVIAPKFGWQPLVNADTGKRFSHLYWVEESLAHRIEEWDDGFQSAFSADDAPRGPDFPSPQDEAAWRAEGLAIAEALKDIYGPDSVTFGPGWDGHRGGDA